MKNKDKKLIPFRQKARDRRAMTVFLGILAVLVLILAFFVVDGGRNWDSIKRYFAYGDEPLRIDRGAASQWAQWNGRLVTAGSDGVVCYDKNGTIEFVASAELRSPELIPGERTLLAYSAGGERLLLLADNGTLRLELKDTGTIYDAHMAPDGAVACLTGGEREKTILRVYDRQQLNCFTVYSDTRYLSRCAVSRGAKVVCAVALEERDGGFDSVAVIYDTSRQEPVAEVSLGNQMIYDAQFWGKDKICLLGDSSLIILNTAGDELGRYAYDALLDYTLSGEDYCALALGDDSGYRLVTLDSECRLLGELPLTDTHIQLAAGGKYLAWITDGLVYMSTSTLKVRDGQEVTGVISGLCVGDPGVCYVLDSRGATRYLP